MLKLLRINNIALIPTLEVEFGPGLTPDGDEVVIRRELQSSGKGRATVNGALVPVSLLRDMAPRLTVIHGQHEPQGLLDPSTHVDLLDHFAGADDGRPLAEF